MTGLNRTNRPHPTFPSFSHLPPPSTPSYAQLLYFLPRLRFLKFVIGSLPVQVRLLVVNVLRSGSLSFCLLLACSGPVSCSGFVCGLYDVLLLCFACCAPAPCVLVHVLAGGGGWSIACGRPLLARLSGSLYCCADIQRGVGSPP